jgi:hypothetical protein
MHEHGCGIRSIALWDEHRLRAFENKVLKIIFISNRHKVPFIDRQQLDSISTESKRNGSNKYFVYPACTDTISIQFSYNSLYSLYTELVRSILLTKLTNSMEQSPS